MTLSSAAPYRVILLFPRPVMPCRAASSVGRNNAKLGERHVGADDVGRQLGLTGEPQAQRPQSIEQRSVARR